MNINNVKPIFKGKVRKESWGGMYYLSGRAYNLTNDTGYFVLKECNGKNSIEDLVHKLYQEYDAPKEIIQQDVNAVVSKLVKLGALTWDGLPEAKLDNAVSSFNKSKNNVSILMDADFRNIIPSPGIIGMGDYKLSAPMKVLVEFTGKCNLKCVHCFADADYKTNIDINKCSDELDTETWCKIIDNIAEQDVFSIFVSGGEPLMRPDIFELVSHISSKGVDHCFLTNMTLLDKKAAQKLKDLKCLKVEGNLDGPDADSYDKFRGAKGAFDATVRGIRACQEVGLPYRLNITVTKQNVYQLKDIIKTAAELGVEELACVPLEMGGRGFKNRSKLEITDKEHIELASYYADVEKFALEEYGDRLIFIPPVINEGLNNQLFSIIDPNAAMPSCGAGRLHCCVSPRGNVMLCPSANEDIPILPGDLKKYSLGQIWNEAEVFKIVRQNNTNCPSDCEGYFRCAGGCHVRTFQKYGAVGAGTDPGCTVMKRSGTCNLTK